MGLHPHADHADGDLHDSRRAFGGRDDRDHPSRYFAVGSIIITALAYLKVGGWHGMTDQLHASGETIKLSMLRSPTDEPGLPGMRCSSATRR